MSKNELKVIARIVLIGTGLYVILQSSLSVLFSLPLMLVSHNGVDAMAITAIIIFILLALAAVYFVVRLAGCSSEKIVIHDSTDDTQISWLAVAFRLVCVTAGIIYLYRTIFGFIPMLSLYIQAILDNEMPARYQHIGPEFAKFIVMLAISFYLACGAPGFVRWQVKRTLKQCNKSIEQQPEWH